MGMDKNSCGHSGLAVSQEWTDGIDTLHADTNFTKLKVALAEFWVCTVRNRCGPLLHG